MRPSATLLCPLALLALIACGKSSQGEGAGVEATAPVVTSLPARPGRSAMPTLAEWNAQQKEVTVKGSSALNCETKIVREYLRVSCRGKNDTGGAPKGVAVRRGGRGEALTYVGAGITSLIVPFVEGIDFAADFSWTDKSHTLTVKWPRGAPKPVVVGVFEGAKSPLDGTAGDAAIADRLCACHKKVRGAPTCDDLIGSANADCDRTYAADCDMLLACSRGEPGAWPRCLPGYTNALMGHCYKKCTPGKGGCASNESCEDGVCIGQ